MNVRIPSKEGNAKILKERLVKQWSHFKPRRTIGEGETVAANGAAANIVGGARNDLDRKLCTRRRQTLEHTGERRRAGQHSTARYPLSRCHVVGDSGSVLWGCHRYGH